MPGPVFVLANVAVKVLADTAATEMVSLFDPIELAPTS